MDVSNHEFGVRVGFGDESKPCQLTPIFATEIQILIRLLLTAYGCDLQREDRLFNIRPQSCQDLHMEPFADRNRPQRLVQPRQTAVAVEAHRRTDLVRCG